MNFIKEENIRNSDENGDIEMDLLKKLVSGTYLDKLDIIQILHVDKDRVAVIFSGFEGLIGFKIINVN